MSSGLCLLNQLKEKIMGFFFVVLEFYDLNSAKNVFMEHFFQRLAFYFAKVVELISVHVFYILQYLIEVIIRV